MINKNEVFVAYSGEYSDRCATGVFSTRERAVAASDGSSYNVESWIVDNDPTIPEGIQYYYIVMRRDGSIVEAREYEYSGHFPEDEVLAGDGYHVSIRNMGRFHRAARSLEHAIKSAGEARAQLLAEGIWK